ncbi:hypothetical protein HJC99_04310 [Candidatus Saccharibacteria bacterium]|nr:hypothetical protein [Candidatus Saccharibacteria bacterium]
MSDQTEPASATVKVKPVGAAELHVAPVKALDLAAAPNPTTAPAAPKGEPKPFVTDASIDISKAALASTKVSITAELEQAAKAAEADAAAAAPSTTSADEVKLRPSPDPEVTAALADDAAKPAASDEAHKKADDKSEEKTEVKAEDKAKDEAKAEPEDKTETKSEAASEASHAHDPEGKAEPDTQGTDALPELDVMPDEASGYAKLEEAASDESKPEALKPEADAELEAKLPAEGIDAAAMHGEPEGHASSDDQPSDGPAKPTVTEVPKAPAQPPTEPLTAAEVADALAHPPAGAPATAAASDLPTPPHDSAPIMPAAAVAVPAPTAAVPTGTTVKPATHPSHSGVIVAIIIAAVAIAAAAGVIFFMHNNTTTTSATPVNKVVNPNGISTADFTTQAAAIDSSLGQADSDLSALSSGLNDQQGNLSE